MKKRTEIYFLLDRSGSMDLTKDDAIGGFNSFIKEQQKVEGECFLTLAQFDHEYIETYVRKNIQEVELLNDDTFIPRGYTALLDGMMRLMGTAEEKIASLSEDEKPDMVIITFLTDGQENCSKEATSERVLQKVKELEAREGWNISFIAADQNAIKDAIAMGISADKSMSYTASGSGTSQAFSNYSQSLVRSRVSQSKFSLKPDDEK